MFLPDEGTEPGYEGAALLSDRLWKGRFGGDRDILGKTVHVNGREITVVGVMAPGFRFPEREDLWLPLGTEDPTDHTSRDMIGVARLGEGTGFAAARDVAARWTEAAASRFPDSHGGWTLRAQPFRYGFVDAGGRRFLSLLVAAVGFVLLLACANVANLLMARASDRKQELAVRSSLGASRPRLAQGVLVESLVLGLAGGILGVLVALIWVSSFSSAIPEELAFWMDVGIDGPILLYALAISLLTSLLFGMLPALQASRANLGESIRRGSRSILGGRGRARAALVIAEVGLGVVLLASATLMVRSFLALQRADPGFEDSTLLSLRIVQAGDQYEDPVARGVYYRDVAERLGSLPGALSAAATSAIPADDGGSPIRILPEGTPEDEALYASAILSTRGLFETLGVDLVSGRFFSPSEELDPEADVVIVGQRVAQRLWPGADPIGRAVVLPETGTFRVVGIAPDLQYEEFGEDLEGARLQLHFPYGVGAYRGMSVLVRAAEDPGRLIAPVRDELAHIDPTLAPFDVLTMPQRRALTTWEQELFGKSFAVFGCMALLLALCGIYGVIAYSVVSRTREIGIRMALGARPRGVQSQVVGDALALAGIGASLGLVASIAFTRGLRGIVFGVDTADPRVFAGAVMALLLTAVVAGWLPAHRASRVDPTEALRAE
jgi:predicted permease